MCPRSAFLRPTGDANVPCGPYSVAGQCAFCGPATEPQRTCDGTLKDQERSPNGPATEPQRTRNGAPTDLRRNPKGPGTEPQRTCDGPPKRARNGIPTDLRRPPKKDQGRPPKEPGTESQRTCDGARYSFPAIRATRELPIWRTRASHQRVGRTACQKTMLEAPRPGR